MSDDAGMTAAFTTDDYATRMRRAVDAGSAEGLAGILAAPGPDLTYFCGYQPTAVTERLTLLVLAAGRLPTMVVPKLERPDAARATGAPAVTLLDWTDGTDPYQATAALIDTGGRYGISDSAWAMHLLGLQRTLPGTSYVALTDGLPMLRAVKDEHEVARLAHAGEGADATFDEILRVRFAGRRETEVAADLASLLRRHGHSQVDFTVVGSGPNGASDEVREVYETVRRAQQAAFEAVRPGITCQEVDRIARQIITEAGYGEYFIHRTGHGIGVTTHEPPYIVEGETRPLVPGMCFSIEPGIYLPGRFGVRIEDIVTVTENGGRRLNNTTHDLQVVS